MECDFAFFMHFYLYIWKKSSTFARKIEQYAFC